jgi:CTP:molybdopterin cytidylyltransferase MocA
MQNNTVFVLLAGGKSERMGVAKGLLKYQKTYWILEQLNRISKSSIKEVYIGLGFNFQHYFNAIHWLQNAQNNFVEYEGMIVKIIINKNPELGSFSTLQTVLKAIPKSSTVLVNHIDIPILNSEELTKIISTNNDIVLPNYEGKNGHPIKMKSSFWKSLINLDISDKNSRLDFQLKKVNPAKISRIEVFDRAIILNLNTKKEWISFLDSFKN